MPLTVNDAIQNSSPKPLDNKYGVFASGAFRAYASVTEANTSISSAFRSIGLTVLVNTGSGNQEYWYQAGVADGNLVIKNSQSAVTSPIIFSSNSIGILQSSGSQGGFLSSGDWTTFNGKVSSVASIGSGTVPVYSGTSAGVVSIKSLSAGANITLGDTAGLITISSPSFAGANLGSGSQLYTAMSGANLQFRSLTAGAGVALVQNTNDINISIAGSAAPTPTTTASATPSVIYTATIPDASAGILVATVVAVVSGSVATCSMAQRYVRYYKSGGVLNIIDGIFDLIPEGISTLTTAGWTIVVNGSNNFDVQVTGQASLNIKWSVTVQNYSNS